MTNFEITIVLIQSISLLIGIFTLVLIFHVALEGSAIKKKHAETHDKTVEGVNMLVEILKNK